MIVNDAFELYTLVMGWHVNNGLYLLLAGTGIILLPFAFIIGRALIEARRNRDKDDIGVQVFNLAEMELYVAFFVMFLCVNPTIELRPQNLTAVVDHCEVAGNVQRDTDEYALGATGTTYDRVGGLSLGADTIKVPLLWYIWDYVASSVSLSAKAALPCQTDIRQISTTIATSRITDPVLADEYSMFLRDCWRPSVNRYLRDKPQLPANLQHVAEDIKWAGSRLLLEGAPYYQHFRAEEGLASFPYESWRDEAKAGSSMLVDGKGYPYCDEWWEHGRYGLRNRLVNHFKNENTETQDVWSGMIRVYQDSGVAPAPTYDDRILKTFLQADMQTLQQRSGWEPRGNEEFGAFFMDKSVAYFTNLFSLPDRTKATVTQAAGPMVRGLMLMLITLLIPILLVASGYNLKAVVTLMAIKFGVFFWIFLFALATWLDNYLLAAWSGAGGGDLGRLERLTSMSSAGRDTAIEALHFITRWLHILLPIAFTWLMASVGQSVGDFARASTGAGMKEAGDAAGQVGQKAQGLGLNTVGKGVGAIGSRFKK